MWTSRAIAACAWASVWAACAACASAADEAPLSAIDWLSEPSEGTDAPPEAEAPSVAPGDTAALGPQAPADPRARALPGALVVPSVAPDAALSRGEPITVTPLAPARSASAGLLPPSVTGLPRALWSGSEPDRLARLFEALPDALPAAVYAMIETLALAEADAPDDAGRSGAEALLAARVDVLVRHGALDPAAALLARAGLDTRERRARAFDVALLIGEEEGACLAAEAAPRSEEDHARRVFCLLRSGDWSAGALTFDAARALGLMDPVEGALLAAFIDDEVASAPLPRPPSDPSPLAFRLFETLGEPMSTSALPVAFARADLRSLAGWKAQVEAAERLARSGAIDGNRLLDLITGREPSASGGVWDRADAIQALDAALAERDAAAVGAALPAAWDAMAEGGTTAALAPVIAPRLDGLALEGEAERLAFRLRLLGGAADDLTAPEGDREGERLSAVASGEAPADPQGALMRAVAEGFDDGPAPERLAGLARADRLGEALLIAAGELAAGADGDLSRLPDALRFLRRVGLEDTARRAALQLLILGG